MKNDAKEDKNKKQQEHIRTRGNYGVHLLSEGCRLRTGNRRRYIELRPPKITPTRVNRYSGRLAKRKLLLNRAI